jgi:hypothetical protein
MTGFVGLFRSQQPASRGAKESVDSFFASVEDAMWRSQRRTVENVLRRISATKTHAEAFQERLAEAAVGDIPALDPLIPCLAESLRYWCTQPGMKGARFLHDRQNVLTDSRIDTVLAHVRSPHPEFLRFTPPVPVGELVRGDSAQHPSLQLADVVAGAGRAAAEFAMGIRDDPTAATLAEVMGPHISENSLWGDDASWERITGSKLA